MVANPVGTTMREYPRTITNAAKARPSDVCGAMSPKPGAPIWTYGHTGTDTYGHGHTDTRTWTR